MNPFLIIALKLFPDVVRHIGAGNGVTDAVVKAVTGLTGTTDPAAAAKVLAEKPEIADDLKIRLAEISTRADAEQRAAELAQLKEVLASQQAQRDSDLKAVQAQISEAQATRQTLAASPRGSTMGIGSLGVSFIVSIAFVGLIIVMMAVPGAFDRLDNNNAAFSLIGALTAAFVTVVGFWLGSSQGSRLKDQANLENQTQSNANFRQLSADVKAEMARPAVIVPPDAAPSAPAVAAVRPRSEVNRFDQCVEVVLDKEGGFVNNPKDPGGATNMGITLNTLRASRHDATLGEQAVRDLTRDEAKEIYFSNYWNALRCSELPAGLDLAVFDLGVNAGPSRAAKMLQKCVYVEADGQIGQITLAAVRQFPAADLIRRFDAARIDFYRGLSTFGTFGQGWLNRVKSVETAALAMAAA